jgi:hypothetical protein
MDKGKKIDEKKQKEVAEGNVENIKDKKYTKYIVAGVLIFIILILLTIYILSKGSAANADPNVKPPKDPNANPGANSNNEDAPDPVPTNYYIMYGDKYLTMSDNGAVFLQTIETTNSDAYTWHISDDCDVAVKYNRPVSISHGSLGNENVLVENVPDYTIFGKKITDATSKIAMYFMYYSSGGYISLQQTNSAKQKIDGVWWRVNTINNFSMVQLDKMASQFTFVKI